MPNDMGRPSWKDYFMDITNLVAKRSTCLRRSVGAILVKNKRILATGYNGAPSGVPHCLDIGCLRVKMEIASGQRHELCRGIHAEQNAIIQAALHGVSIKDSTLFCTKTFVMYPLPLSSEASITVPIACLSGLAFNSRISASKTTFSSSSSIP